MAIALQTNLRTLKTFAIVATLFFQSTYAVAAPKKSASRVATVSSDSGAKFAQNFLPLFNRGAVPESRSFADFVGRDPNIMNAVDLSAQAARVRGNQMNQIQGDMRLQKPGSEQYLNLGTSLARLYEEQAIYLENLRAMGMRDSSIVDLNHAIKSVRSNLISTLDKLMVQFPKSSERTRWKAITLISRLKIGDPSVAAEAKAFAGSGRGVEGGRVLLVGMAIDFSGGATTSRFGSLDNALQLQMDSVSQAVFKIYKAARSSPRAAQLLYEEAAKDAQGVRTSDGKLGPIAIHAGAKLVDMALATDPANASKEVVSTLQQLGLQSFAYYYMERPALQNINAQPKRAMAQYADLVELNELSADFVNRIEVRILDIALKSRDLVAIDGQWTRISKVPEVMTNSEVVSRMVQTQQLNWQVVEKQASQETVERFVRQHDFFAAASQSYARNEIWTIRLLEALSRVRRWADVATRADGFAQSASSTGNKLIALKYAASAREKILGVTSEPAFVEGRKLGGESDVAARYIATLEKSIPLVKGKDPERMTFQIAYITHLIGDFSNARVKFESAVQKYPRGTYAAKTISFLLNISIRAKDYSYTEKIARLAEAKRIKPSQKAHQNLRAIVESSVYAQATDLAAQNRFDAAGEKFDAFQKEFPKSRNADTALNLAAKNHLAAKKVDSALNSMERLLKSYPSSKYAFETRWQAAETAGGAKQYLRSANHYEAFAKIYKGPGMQRKAWLKAADMQKAAGRYANTVANLEIHLRESKNQQEKVKAAKDIADIQYKYGKITQALSAYQRVMKISKAKDDEIWAYAQIIEIYLKQGNEGAARELINRVLKMRPTSQDGFRMLAKAKFSLARMEAQSLRTIKIPSDKNVLNTLKQVSSRFDNTRNLYVAACEVPGLDLCAIGYYEAARLAEDVATKMTEVQLSAALKPGEFEQSKIYIASGSERLGRESQSLAEQAEQALASNNVDKDMADRIRSYSQQHRGAEPLPDDGMEPN